LYQDQYILDHPTETANYPRTCHEQCGLYAERWAWYSFMNVTANSSSYVNLRKYATGITAPGQVFAGL
jgi:hypothetical protein